jgi:CheY-like chemotaxis protein
LKNADITSDVIDRVSSPSISITHSESAVSQTHSEEFGVLVEKPAVGSPPDITSMLTGTSPILQQTEEACNLMRPPEKKQVLIIDMNSLCGQIFKGFLPEEKYDVKWVPNGPCAVEFLQSRKADLVLVADNTFPMIQDVIQHIRDISVNTKVIAVLSHGSHHLYESVIECGASHVLLKPVHRDQLLSLL